MSIHNSNLTSIVGGKMSAHTKQDKDTPRRVNQLFDNRITFRELCARFPHWSEHTLRKWRKKGMPGQRVMGGKLMFDPDEVALWIERHS